APPAWTRGCAATTGSNSSCCSGCATGSGSTWACPKTTTTSCWTTGATQRPGPPRVHYPERQARPPPPARGGDGQCQPPARHPRPQPLDLQVDDPGQLAGGQRVEHDHVVQPVQELRLERTPERGHDRVPLGRLVAERR